MVTTVRRALLLALAISLLAAAQAQAQRTGAVMRRALRPAILATLLALTFTATAAAKPLPRVTDKDARASGHVVLDLLGDALEERVVIAPCQRHGKIWRTCRARVGQDRYLLRARYKNHGGDVLVWATRLP
jgi:hypothetical protein